MPLLDVLGSSAFVTYFLTNAPIPPAVQVPLLRKYWQVVDNWTLTEEALKEFLSTTDVYADDLADAFDRPFSTEFIQWALDWECRQEPLHALAQGSWGNATVAQRHEFAHRAKRGFADALLFHDTFDESATDMLIKSATSTGLINYAARYPDARVSDTALEYALSHITTTSWSESGSKENLGLLLYRRPSLLSTAVRQLPLWLLEVVCESLLLGQDDPYDGAVLQDLLMRRIKRSKTGSTVGVGFFAAKALTENPMCTETVQAQLRTWFASKGLVENSTSVANLAPPVKTLESLSPAQLERVFQWANATVQDTQSGFTSTMNVAAMAFLAGVLAASPVLPKDACAHARRALVEGLHTPTWLRDEVRKDTPDALQPPDHLSVLGPMTQLKIDLLSLMVFTEGKTVDRWRLRDTRQREQDIAERIAANIKLMLDPSGADYYTPRCAPIGALMSETQTQWRDAPVKDFNTPWYTCSPMLGDPKTAQLWWFTRSLGESLPAFELTVQLTRNPVDLTLGELSDAVRAALY